MEKTRQIALISLGCSKNTVDSEIMLGMLSKAGYQVGLEYDSADLIIINTCSFIQQAESESVKAIMEQVGQGKKLIIAGCLAQKYGNDLLELIPEAAAIVGTSNIGNIVNIVNRIFEDFSKQYLHVSEDINYLQPDNASRYYITMGPSSYVKISEGCNWHCSYCLIPSLKGQYRSRNIEAIVEEAKSLAKNGTSEIVLIAQDTTNYGTDIYQSLALTKLLERLENIDEINWIRLMYTYPANITDELIEFIAASKKLVKYLDIPLQHAHPEILKLMKRPGVDIDNLLDKLRTRIPQIAIRTCFIVGFPGETEDHFEYLYNFVKKQRFNRLGVFEYSREKNTPAFKLSGQVKAGVKKQRRKLLMQLQQKISLENHEKMVDRKIDVLLEEIRPSGMGVGRSYLDAPEIDGSVFINSITGYLPGDIIPVTIKKVNAYDLYGVVEN